MTEAAALAIVGNFQCESNCEPFRVEGDFSPYKTISKAYVQGVTDGSISRYTFSHDAKGFGLYQLTFWSRKEEYYDYWKASGGKLDSAELQTKFAIKELKRDFSGLWNYLMQTNDVFTACSRICREFERPAVNNIDARYQAANRFKYELDLNEWQGGGGDEPTPEPTPAPTPVDHSLKLRTIDKHCESFDEVKLVELLLTLRSYNAGYNTIWDAVKEFQRDNGLDADGIVGKKTWTELLKY
jgi:hypothetical protein